MDAHRRPSFVAALNLGTVLGLPEWSLGPRGDARVIAAAAIGAGYTAVQGGDDPAYAEAGLVTYGSGRVIAPDAARDVLARQRDLGHRATTLHVGRGFETDAEALALLEAVLAASGQLGHTAYVETHRATVTQDMRRTLTWIERLPELRFNADLSHWYTGLEMSYSDFEEKLDLLTPFFARVGFIHGRIGNNCSMQVAVGNGGRDGPHVPRFAEMWTRCYQGAAGAGQGGEPVVFAPELLPEVVDTPDGPLYIDYALTRQLPDGTVVETSDRWEQGLKLVDIARASHEAASARASLSL